MTTILGGGLHVGVLLHGKKIRDDNRTLVESGISQSEDVDTVGFMLEPNSPTKPSPRQSPEEFPAPLPCDSPKFVNRYLTLILVLLLSFPCYVMVYDDFGVSARSQINPNNDRSAVNTPEKPSITDSNRPFGITKDLVPSPATELTERNVSNSKALVPVPDASMETLAVVPVSQRSKRCDIGQRRTRRPFSVSEVEALVRAVEKLGTGRYMTIAHSFILSHIICKIKVVF